LTSGQTFSTLSNSNPTLLNALVAANPTINTNTAGAGMKPTNYLYLQKWKNVFSLKYRTEWRSLV